MATGDREEYEQILRNLGNDGLSSIGAMQLAIEHILKRLGPPEPDAEQALAEAAEAFYASHKKK